MKRHPQLLYRWLVCALLSLSLLPSGAAGLAQPRAAALPAQQDNQLPNMPRQFLPGAGVAVRSAQVTLEARDTGDPDNGPRAYRNFQFELHRTTGLTWTLRTEWVSANRRAVTLPSGGDYIWRVRSGDGIGGSPWTAWRRFTYSSPTPVPPTPFPPPNNQPPNMPTQVTPASGATITTNHVALRARDTGDPDNGPRPTRDFQFVIRKLDQTWVVTSSWVLTNTWTAGPLDSGDYQWRVRSGDGDRGSVWSGWRGFTYANTPPNIPRLLAPVASEVFSTGMVLLRVQDAGDSDGKPQAARDFQFQVVGTNVITPTLRESLWQPSASWLVGLTAFAGTYRWRVRSGDGDRASDWSAWRTFHYRNTPPNIPIPKAPADGAIWRSKNVTLQVQDAGDDNRPWNYRDFQFVIERADDTTGATRQVSIWSAEDSWTVTLPSHGTYRWWVRAGDGDMSSNWSAPRTLTYSP